MIWASAAISEDLVSDYAVLNGVTKDEARQVLSARMDKADSEMVLPGDMRPAIELAIYSHDQVRAIAGMGGVAFLSFDQTAVEVMERRHKIDMTPQAAKDLLILQAEGLKIMQDNL